MFVKGLGSTMSKTTETAVESVETGSMSMKEFMAAYRASVASGGNWRMFCEEHGLKLESARVRLANVKKTLKASGLTPEQVESILPPFAGRSPRNAGSRKDALDFAAELLAELAPVVPAKPEPMKSAPKTGKGKK